MLNNNVAKKFRPCVICGIGLLTFWYNARRDTIDHWQKVKGEKRCYLYKMPMCSYCKDKYQGKPLPDDMYCKQYLKEPDFEIEITGRLQEEDWDDFRDLID